MTTKFKPGHAKKGGRKKGVPNKATVEVKDALNEAFNGSGGTPALIRFAKANPAQFYALWAKMLPVDAKLSGEGILTVSVVYSHE